MDHVDIFFPFFFVLYLDINDLYNFKAFRLLFFHHIIIMFIVLNIVKVINTNLQRIHLSFFIFGAISFVVSSHRSISLIWIINIFTKWIIIIKHLLSPRNIIIHVSFIAYSNKLFFNTSFSYSAIFNNILALSCHNIPFFYLLISILYLHMMFILLSYFRIFFLNKQCNHANCKMSKI